MSRAKTLCPTSHEFRKQMTSRIQAVESRPDFNLLTRFATPEELQFFNNWGFFPFDRRKQ